MFGSNLRLGARTLELKNTIEGETVLKNKGETQWTAFLAAREKLFSSPEIPESMILVRLYGRVRTEFDTHGGEIRVR